MLSSPVPEAQAVAVEVTLALAVPAADSDCVVLCVYVGEPVAVCRMLAVTQPELVVEAALEALCEALAVVVEEAEAVALAVPCAGEAEGVLDSLAAPVRVAVEEALWLALAVPCPAAAGKVGVAGAVAAGEPLPPGSGVAVEEEVAEMLGE